MPEFWFFIFFLFIIIIIISNLFLWRYENEIEKLTKIVVSKANMKYIDQTFPVNLKFLAEGVNA